MDENLILLEATDLKKTFPGIRALNGVSIKVRSGEVLALVGENGAGKSTLIKIIGGIYPRDGGTIRIGAEEVEFRSPVEAMSAGIQIIHQELNLVPYLSVAQNIFLGMEPVGFLGVIDRRAMESRSVEVLESLGMKIDVKKPVGELSVAEQQVVEIAKALIRNAKILIMDEPTATLTRRETESLFVMIDKLRAQGKGIVYITHRLEEVKRVADRLMVLRDGLMVGEGEVSRMSTAEIIRLMVGREINEQFPYCPGGTDEEILRVEDLTKEKTVQNVSFTLKKGEVLGIFGLVGAGRTELARLLFGADQRDNGHIYLEGRALKRISPGKAIEKGIFYLPEDRKREGVFLERTIRSNITVSALNAFCGVLGAIKQKESQELVGEFIQRFSINPPFLNYLCGRMSGGNQQKVLLARSLMTHPKILILDEPTRGIDVGSKVEIYNLINKFKAEGMGIILISSDLPEVLRISDRILVMSEGKITGELSHAEADQTSVMEYALGADNNGGKRD